MGKDGFGYLTLEQCRQRLRDPGISNAERIQLLCRQGRLLAELEQWPEAIASFDQALLLRPDYAPALHQRGLALDRMGQYAEAIAAFDRAIALDTTPSSQVWCDRGAALIRLDPQRPRTKEALTSFDRAIAIDPDNAEAWSGRGFVLAMMKRYKEALANCDRSLELQPDSAKAWTNRGAVLSWTNRHPEALANFERALELQPTFSRAWNNRGIALLNLDRYEDAQSSFKRAIDLAGESHESWRPNAWFNYGYSLMKLGQHEEAIASFEQAQALRSNFYAPALMKVGSLILSGRFFTYATRSQTRGKLWQDFCIIAGALKYRLLPLILLFLVLAYAPGAWTAWLQQGLTLLLSIGIVGLMVAELWKRRSGLGFVGRVYFQSGILTYFRAAFILILTLTTFVASTTIAPPFMYWGWANLVFGQPGNIIFQPLNLIQPSPSPIALSPLPSTAPALTSPTPQSTQPSDPDSSPAIPSPIPELDQEDQISLAPHSSSRINLSLALMVGFWGLLILLVPFWARLEEYIFRKGGNTWKQIAVRSTLFGLVHLIAGIPLIGGIVLILPGFLFAWRYKSVRDRHFKHHGDALQAEEAGVFASTAVHAVYNAILITFAVGQMILALWYP